VGANGLGERLAGGRLTERRRHGFVVVEQVRVPGDFRVVSSDAGEPNRDAAGLEGDARRLEVGRRQRRFEVRQRLEADEQGVAVVAREPGGGRDRIPGGRLDRSAVGRDERVRIGVGPVVGVARDIVEELERIADRLAPDALVGVSVGESLERVERIHERAVARRRVSENVDQPTRVPERALLVRNQPDLHVSVSLCCGERGGRPGKSAADDEDIVLDRHLSNPS